MTESFVPIAPLAPAAKQNGFTAFQLKVVPSGEAKPAFPTNGHTVPAPTAAHVETCGEPTVVLQRNGDTVTSIRVQCTCGKVIELNCTY